MFRIPFARFAVGRLSSVTAGPPPFGAAMRLKVREILYINQVVLPNLNSAK